MCGIFGIHDPAGVDQSALRRMASALAHRGPDGEGLHVDGAIGLGNRRLAVIDPAGGAQPQFNEDGSLALVHNGEIYNYRSLRSGLKARGHRFSTQSDTEVILHLYEELGDDCVHELDGMFAFALWDSRRNRLLLARDRLGQKPLFHARLGETFLFASEAKALLAADLGPRELDLTSLRDFLSLRFVPSPRTLLQGVSKLAPAHRLVVENGSEREERYWRLSFRDRGPSSEEEAVEIVREQVVRSIEAHTVSDVPIGAFLSGGLDSGLVCAVLASRLDQPFEAFVVGMRESELDELPQAREMARHLGCRLHERIAELSLIETLPQLVYHLDEPCDPIAACFFQASALASEHVKVVLGGDGGDELFAGFDRYLGVPRLDGWARLPGWLRGGLGSMIRGLPEGSGYKSLAQKLLWAEHVGRGRSPAERYAAATSFFRFDQPGQRELLSDEVWSELRDVDSCRVIVEAYEAADAETPLDRMLAADYETRLPEHSLVLTDRLSMAHGLETRSPFLDHRLVELLAGIPSALKVRGGVTKSLMRSVAKGLLPDQARRLPKQGFMLPLADWFRGPLRNFLHAALGDSRLLRMGLIRPAAVERLLDEHDRGRRDHHVRLWMLLALEVWIRIYLDRESPEQVSEALASIRATCPA